MAKRIRRFDVLAAISTLLLALTFGGWAINVPEALSSSARSVDIVIMQGHLAVFGTSDPVPQSVRTPNPPRALVNFESLGINYMRFNSPGVGYRTANGIAAFDWTLAISLWYFVALFSILPLIWLIRELRRKSKVESADSPPNQNTFALKSIFIAVTLVAVAGGMQALLQNRSYQLGYSLLLWYGSGALAGAAIFGMVRRPIVGAFIGLVFQGILIVVMKALFRISF